MKDSIPRLRTPGVMAADLGEPLHRVLYVLRTRSTIQPTAMAGRLRLYDSEAQRRLEQELAAITSRHSPKGGA